MYERHEFLLDNRNYKSNISFIEGEKYAFLVNGNLESPSFLNIVEEKLEIDYSFKSGDIVEIFQVSTTSDVNEDHYNEVNQDIINSIAIMKTLEAYT